MTDFTPADLNELQLAGIISDNCVDSRDIAEPNRTRAHEWLRKRARLGQEEPLFERETV